MKNLLKDLSSVENLGKGYLVMPEQKKLRRTLKKPPESNLNLEHNNSENTPTTEYKAPKRKSTQQKTIRLDEDVIQTVKVVAKFLGKTEQDFIIDSVKLELNKHLEAAKAQITAQIASLPSQIQ